MWTLFVLFLVVFFIVLVLIYLRKGSGETPVLDDLKTIYRNAPFGVLRFDEKGKITFISPVAEKILGKNKSEVKNQTIVSLGWFEIELSEWIKSSNTLEFKVNQNQVLSLNIQKSTSGYFFGFLSDVTSKVNTDETLYNANIIFDAVTFAQERFIHTKNIENLSSIFEQILYSVMAVTKSSHGLIAQVDAAENQKMKLYATTHPSFKEDLKRIQAGQQHDDPDFAYLYPIIQKVVVQKHAILGNGNEEKDALAERSALQHGYVYPLIYHNEILGVLAIGKEDGEYSMEVTEYLLPMLQASIILIEGFRIELERIEAEQQLKDRDIKLTESLRKLELKSEEIAQARDQAQAANNAKSSFLANMSHEIRTPLNGIVGMTELLKRTELTAKQEKFIDTVANQSEVLLTLINDILDLSKIEAGEMTLEAREFNLLEAIKNVTNLLAHKAREKGIGLLIDYDPELPLHYVADSIRIRQVIINLIGNSIKFTDEGYVIVKITQKESLGNSLTIRFEVIDSGIGISADSQEKLFENFQQADVSVTRKYGGTGLGLAICRKLTRAMGGEIGVISEEGKGANFWFELPLPLGENKANLSLTGVNQVKQTKIVLVTDNTMEKDIILRYTRSWDIDSIVCHSLENALDELHANQNQRNIVLLDEEFSHGEVQIDNDSTVVVYMIPEDYPHGDLEKKQVAFINKPLYPDELRDVICSSDNQKNREVSDE